MSENAFIRALEEEVRGAAHDQLVDTYIWANKQSYGSTDVELRARAEAWAKAIEDAGKTMEVLEALAGEDDGDG